jgi:hypothetical protein
MKQNIKIYTLLLLVAGSLWSSCTKNENKAYLKPGQPNTLTAAPAVTTLVLQQVNAASNAITLLWTKADFGYPAAINYRIQISRAGTNFATSSTTEINAASLPGKTLTVGELNAKLLEIIPFGSAERVEIRLKSDIGAGVPPIYSNILYLTVTAYRDIINYNFPQALWIAGNYQGWDPGSAPKIVDKNASGTTGSNYEGYINFNNAAPEFKMVKGNNWGAGDFGSAGPGALGNGGPNLTLSGGAGVYLLRANTSNMTWSNAKITTWGIIGSATAGGWGSSTPMTFNPADGTWTLTANLIGGQELKFRANNDWAINFGDNAPMDNKPDYGGSNIPIANSGSYTIILDLGIAGNYSYSIRRN